METCETEHVWPAGLTKLAEMVLRQFPSQKSGVEANLLQLAKEMQPGFSLSLEQGVSEEQPPPVNHEMVLQRLYAFERYVDSLCLDSSLNGAA